MGNFKIEIEACGGHGFARDVKQGERIPYENAHENELDRIAYDMVQDYKQRVGGSLMVATLTHWPESTPIVDNLLTGVREVRDFNAGSLDEPILRFFPSVWTDKGRDRLATMYCHFAHMLVATMPKSAERTLALRDLLASYDNAKRAASGQ